MLANEGFLGQDLSIFHKAWFWMKKTKQMFAHDDYKDFKKESSRPRAKLMGEDKNP